MNRLFEKQVYLRLSEDGAGFFYTAKYGRISTGPREMRLAAKADAPGLVKWHGVPTLSREPIPVRTGVRSDVVL